MCEEYACLYGISLVMYVKYGLDPSYVSWLLLTRFICSFLFLSHYYFTGWYYPKSSNLLALCSTIHLLAVALEFFTSSIAPLTQQGYILGTHGLHTCNGRYFGVTMAMLSMEVELLEWVLGSELSKLSLYSLWVCTLDNELLFFLKS